MSVVSAGCGQGFSPHNLMGLTKILSCYSESHDLMSVCPFSSALCLIRSHSSCHYDLTNSQIILNMTITFPHTHTHTHTQEGFIEFADALKRRQNRYKPDDPPMWHHAVTMGTAVGAIGLGALAAFTLRQAFS